MEERLMGKYDILFQKFNDLQQYSIHFAKYFSEHYGKYYSEVIIGDICQKLKVPVDFDLIHKREKERKYGEDGICLFRSDVDGRCFILLGCNPGDWINSIVVRCMPSDGNVVKESLLKWYYKVAELEGLLDAAIKIDELKNDMYIEENILSQIIRMHKLS
jgi:hypothetical protein